MGAILGIGGGAQSQKTIVYSGLNVSSSRMDLPVPIFWGQRRISTNAIWYNNFKKHPVSAKGKGASKGTQYDYTAATATALSEGPIDSIVNVWAAGSTTTTTTLAKLNMTLFTGTAAQSPWSFVSTNFPAQARSYGLTAYLACSNQDLGESATIPDNAFECVRSNGFAYTHTTNGWIDPATHISTSAIDVLLSDCLVDLVTNPQYGQLLEAGDIASTTQWATYMRAQGLFFSPLLNSQVTATSLFDRWAQLSNTWIYWSGTQLQFVPLGDSTVTGNGVTYTPDNAIAYDLGPGDFIGDEPVSVARMDPADCFNRTVLQITDRTIGYVSNPIEFKDQTLVDTYGLRDQSSTQADEICDPVVGAIAAQLIGRRAAYVRNTYSFKTSYRFIRCLPGTPLTLTDPNIGINKMRVRVATIEEADDGSLAFTCEEFPSLVGTFSPTGSSLAGAPTNPNEYVDPGSVNTPAILEPNASFTGGLPQIVIAASGGPNWGGCFVTISFDGTEYSTIGRIVAPAVQGVLTSTLPNHADPDTVDTLAVDCTESLSLPTPVTNADADALRTISWLSAQPALVSGSYVVPTVGEMLAFGDVSATGTYAANLTYLRRGQYGFAPSSHASGDQFTVIDVVGSTGTSLVYDLPPQYIGQPIYIKLLSYNAFGNEVQDPSAVLEYKYTPTGLGYGTGTGGVPKTPTGLIVVSGNGQDNIAWNANDAVDNVSAYQLYAAVGPGGSFGSASLIFDGKATHFVWPGRTDGDEWTYFVVAVNAVGPSPHTSGVDATAVGIVTDQIVPGAISSATTLGPMDWVSPAVSPAVETNFFGGLGTTYLDLGAVPPAGTYVILSLNGYVQRNTGRDPIVTTRIYRGIFGTGSPVLIATGAVGGGSDNHFMPIVCSGPDYAPGRYYTATIETDSVSPPPLSEIYGAMTAQVFKR